MEDKKQTESLTEWETNNDTIDTEYGSRFVSVDHFDWVAVCKMQMSVNIWGLRFWGLVQLSAGISPLASAYSK